ncbi:unnamed protein product, partial [Nesidiocoris tenuis]
MDGGHSGSRYFRNFWTSATFAKSPNAISSTEKSSRSSQLLSSDPPAAWLVPTELPLFHNFDSKSKFKPTQGDKSEHRPSYVVFPVIIVPMGHQVSSSRFINNPDKAEDCDFRVGRLPTANWTKYIFS